MKSKKYMLLVCVYDHRSGNLFKQRIAETHCDIEEWIERYAESWANCHAMVQCDEYCNGFIYSVKSKELLYTFETKNIAVL